METEIEGGRNRGREGWRDEERDGGREGERNKEGWRAQPTTEWVGMGETSEVSQGSLVMEAAAFARSAPLKPGQAGSGHPEIKNRKKLQRCMLYQYN